MDDLGAESLDIYDMVCLLEDELGLEISDEAVENLRTVGDVVSFIRVTKGLELQPHDLVFAVKSSNLALVQHLLEAGTDVNRRDIAGRNGLRFHVDGIMNCHHRNVMRRLNWLPPHTICP